MAVLCKSLKFGLRLPGSLATASGQLILWQSRWLLCSGCGLLLPVDPYCPALPACPACLPCLPALPACPARPAVLGKCAYGEGCSKDPEEHLVKGERVPAHCGFSCLGWPACPMTSRLPLAGRPRSLILPSRIANGLWVQLHSPLPQPPPASRCPPACLPACSLPLGPL